MQQLMIGFIFIFSGCVEKNNSSFIAIGDNNHKKLKKILSITSNNELSSQILTGFDVDSSGNIFTVDKATDELKIFSSEGILVKSKKYEGTGPGELTNDNFPFLSISDSIIYVYNFQNKYINCYNYNLDFLEREIYSDHISDISSPNI